MLEFAGREDALYGRVILEYKKPGLLESNSEFRKAKDQVKQYISEEAGDEASFSRFFGVILDGFNISFVRFRNGKWEEQDHPSQVNGRTVMRLLESIRGLRRKPIDSEFLLLDFGPRSQISKDAITALYESIVDRNTARTNMLFNDWRRVFSQVCAYSPGKLGALIGYYGLKKDADVEKLLFAIHTYYTILMKLLTSEIVTLFADSLLGSYLKRVEDSYYRGYDEMRTELTDLEEGGIFATVGIHNFLEADYFAWYLDEWNEAIAKSIFAINQRLLDYEPATVELNPERVKDLFKRLYQNLVPREIRHSIGEYFTPDWLAELLLDEVGYNGDPDKRVLDPACGSGTFLVLCIRRVREHAEENFIEERSLLERIIKNVRGIDLNPLAVLASKANYLIALSELLRFRPREGIEIPIYLADSISVVRRVTPYGEDEFELQTNEGKFWVTKEVIDKNLLIPVLGIVSEGVKVTLNEDQFEASLSKDIPLRPDSVKSLTRLYGKIQKLERDGKDKIWTSLLRNSFSPMLIGKFDFVVGNPPWINWESLPEFYRDNTKHLWETYGLLGKGQGSGLGREKRDISMLFTASCLQRYVDDKGTLGFLVPFNTLRTQAGLGFRRFLATTARILSVHDFSEVDTFEGALNRPAMIVLRHGETTFPVESTSWKKLPRKDLPIGASFDEVSPALEKRKTAMRPVEGDEKPGSAWLIAQAGSLPSLAKITGQSDYRAYAGVYTGVSGIYWIDIAGQRGGDLLIVRNLAEAGKTELRSVTATIERKFVHPLLRGRNIKRWSASPNDYIIIPTDKEGETVSINDMKTKTPETYKYFNGFFKELVNRSGEPYKTKLLPYKKVLRENAERTAPPFYWLFNAKQAFSPFKVAWAETTVSFNAAVIGPIHDNALGADVVIPAHTCVLVPTAQEDEAYYLCAILNSSPVRAVIMGYAYVGKRLIHPSPHVMKNVRIPKFDSRNSLHHRLKDLAMEAEKAVRSGQNERVSEIERKVDDAAAELFALNFAELKATIESLKHLEKH